MQYSQLNGVLKLNALNLISPLCASESFHRRVVDCWFWLAADLWTLSKWGDGILISNKLQYTEHLVDLINLFISHAIISSGLGNEYEEDFDWYNQINKNIYSSSLITITAILIIITAITTIWVVLADDHFFSSQLYLSTRRGAWILNRVGDNGLPLDMAFNRILYSLQAILPFSFFCGLAERQLNQRFDHALYNLKPKHRCVLLGYFNVSYWISTTWPIEIFT